MIKSNTTEKRLLEATLKLISKKGYLGATTREIAQEAGVTELTLFRHFGSKEKLFEEVLNSYTFLPRLKELLPKLEGHSYDEALKVIGITFLERLRERKALIKIMLSEINLYPDKIRNLHKDFIGKLTETLADFIRSLQKKDMLRRISPEMAARAFFGTLFSYFNAEEIMRDRSISKEEREKVVKEFVDIFVYGTLKK